MSADGNAERTPSSQPRPIRMLLVDDSEGARTTVREYMNILRPDLEIVATASDGCEAVEAVRKHRPDLVLMDVAMPRMNGVVAASRIRREFPATRIVLYSTHDMTLMREALQSCGADAFVPKSGLREHFGEVMERLFGSSGEGKTPES